MTSRRHDPTRLLSHRPDLAQIKRQAKELLKAFAAAEPAAIAEVDAHFGGAHDEAFALHDAQLVLARAYGFASWPKLKAYVDGVTVGRLIDAVRAGDLATVRAMVALRPELVRLDAAENDEHRALHYAVLCRHAPIVRFLMQRGADARKGIWPHRDATSPLTLATDRGYLDITEIIRDEETRRASPSFPVADLQDSDEFERHDRHEAGKAARHAVANGDATWLRARHAEGALTPDLGLLSCAVTSNRQDMLSLLLELGLDPDERGTLGGLDEVVPTWGAPLRECAIEGQVQMAEALLAAGADPNTNVYAASPAMFEAYKRQDAPMIAVLERYGGRLTPTSVGILGLAAEAARMLEEDAAPRTADAGAAPMSTVAEDLLWGAIESPAPEIVRLALEHIDWPRDDPRWNRLLENGLYLNAGSNRPSHLEGFRLTLERSGPNVRSTLGTTVLHDIAASRGGLTASDRVAFATLVLDAGGRLDLRDTLLESTPLGWACRWGRIELVQLLLERGADPVEEDAAPWATPHAWAEKMHRADVLEELQRARPGDHFRPRTR
jgi:ankyrin repeat protein